MTTRALLPVLAVLSLACAGIAPEPYGGRLVSLTDDDGTSLANLAYTGETSKAPFQGSATLDRYGDSLLVVFPEPTLVGTATLRACKGTGPADYTIYADGARMGNGRLQDEFFDNQGVELLEPVKEVRFAFEGPTVSSTLCVFQVDFQTNRFSMRVGPPKTVKGTATASSTLAPENAYHPTFAFDGRPDYAWLEGQPDNGVGSWIQLSTASAVTVHGVSILDGYQRSAAHYDGNSRASQVRLDVDGTAVETFDLADTMGFQDFTLDKPVTGFDFRFHVLAAHDSKGDPDLSISEIRLLDEEGPLDISVAAPRPKMATNHPVSKAAGTWYVDACTGHKRGLKIRGNSFMYVERATASADAPLTKVFDGAWGVGRKTDAPWSQITLHGRERVGADVPMFFDPTVRGGEVELAGARVGLVRAESVSDRQLNDVMADLDTTPSAGCALLKGHEALKTQGALYVRGPRIGGVWVPRPPNAEEAAEGWVHVTADTPSGRSGTINCDGTRWMNGVPRSFDLRKRAEGQSCVITWSDDTTAAFTLTGDSQVRCGDDGQCVVRPAESPVAGQITVHFAVTGSGNVTCGDGQKKDFSGPITLNFAEKKLPVSCLLKSDGDLWAGLIQKSGQVNCTGGGKSFSCSGP